MSTKPTNTTEASLVGSKRGLATEEVSMIDTTNHQELVAMPASKILKVNGAANKQVGGKPVGGAASKSIEIRDTAQKDSESDDEENEKVKWKTLEHHGVIFFESYKPHGVKILHKVSTCLYSDRSLG